MGNIKPSNIPNRLRNVSAEHPYVAGAVDIIDDRLGRNQQAVNEDTYRKGETYSKEQLNNLITTPEQKYVTVVADDQTTAATDVLPPTGEADTVYRVGNWDGTQYDPTVYSEYAWEGTEYIFLDKKQYTLAEAVDFINPDARKRAKVVTVGAVADVHGYYDDNPEFAEVKTDSEGRIIEVRTNDGTKVEYCDLEVYGNADFNSDINVKGSLNVNGEEGSINTKLIVAKKSAVKRGDDIVSESYAIDDPEERLDIVLGTNGEIVSYRDKDGTLHENAGIVVRSISFSDGNKSFIERLEYEGKKCVVQDMALLYPEEIYKSILENYTIGGFQANTTGQYKQLSLLWFTDVHESIENLSRIKAFYDVYKNYFNDVIATGDIMNKFYNDFSFWESLELQNVLMVMGNHDPETKDDGTGREVVTEQEAYEQFYEPYLADTDIICDENKTYWYKDYPTVVSDECKGGIRLIGLHQELNWADDGQMSWLHDRLEECLEEGNKKAVIIAVHGPFQYRSGYNCIDVNCSFNALYKVPTDVTYINTDMLSTVQNFIDNGGEFICWMGGHTHQDWFVRSSKHPDQVLVILGTASYKSTWRAEHMFKDTKSMDRFNIFSVDPVNKHIRLFRIGIDQDIYGRHVGSLVYDYKNKNLISNF